MSGRAPEKAPEPRPNIAALHAYAPGEQPGQASRVIKLNTNENPYPPAPAVLQAIASVTAEQLRQYPSPTAAGFRAAAAERHGLTPEHVIATNGGDELLRLLLTTFCTPSRGQGRGGVGYAEPSYSLYPVLAAIHDTPLTTVSLNDDWTLPEDYAARLNAAGCAVAFVVNPHAPSGRWSAAEVLGPVADAFDGVLVIDEAYVDFAPGDCVSLLRECQNVVLLRSLSKGYGLAGLRFGYGLADPALIAAMDKARDSYNTDAVSQAAAVAALRDQGYAQSTWQRVVDERARLTDALTQRGFAVHPSHSNFVLATPPAVRTGADARTLYAGLKQRGILVRYFDAPRLDDKLRITVGTPEQDDALLAALDALG